MYTVLNVTGELHSGNIGFVLDNFETVCQLAAKFHFDGVNIQLHEKDSLPLAEKKGILTRYNLIPATCACSVLLTEYFSDHEFKKSLKIFEKDAEALHYLGCNTVTLSIDPFAHQYNFYDNFRLISQRLKKMKPILEANSLKLALEFIGAPTRRMNVPYDFIHTIDGVRCLIASAEMETCAGFMLDAYHWTASGGSILDIMHLPTDYILYVELSDASARYDLYTMPEYERELPLTTGMVNVEGLLEELTRKHYKGPIALEPWNAKIKSLEPEEAVRTIKNSIDDCMRIVTY